MDAIQAEVAAPPLSTGQSTEAEDFSTVHGPTPAPVRRLEGGSLDTTLKRSDTIQNTRLCDAGLG